jgi:hypothetical protein
LSGFVDTDKDNTTESISESSDSFQRLAAVIGLPLVFDTTALKVILVYELAYAIQIPSVVILGVVTKPVCSIKGQDPANPANQASVNLFAMPPGTRSTGLMELDGDRLGDEPPQVPSARTPARAAQQ